jgi:ubiquinone/menaquinone biosynthesis C-methylase UbiE
MLLPGALKRLAQEDGMLPAGLSRHEVIDVYSRLAPIYDAWAAWTEVRARRRCLELAAIADGEHVLEVAAGTGLLFAEIVRANPSGRNEGIDVTEAMLERARKRVAAVRATRPPRLTVGDARRLDFPDASFDVLVNNYMFDLLPEDDFAIILAELARVLRPGGRMVLVNMARSDRWHCKLWEAIYRIRPSLLGGCRGVSLAPYVEEAGFVQITTEVIEQSGFPSEVIRAIRPPMVSTTEP